MWSASTWRASALAPKLFPGCLCGKLFSSHSPFPETYDEEPFFLILQETEEEIQKLISMQKESQNVQLALICVKEGLKDSEISLVDYNMAMDCMGIDTGIKSYRINIKAVDNKHGLRMYGSGRSDRLNGKDNTVKVPRDAMKSL